MALHEIKIPKSVAKRLRTNQFGSNPVNGLSNEAFDLQQEIQDALDDGSLVVSGGGGGGATNLSVGATTGTTLVVVSSSGTDATLPSATGSQAGLLSATDKTKLDGLTNYVHPNHTGDVTSTGDGTTTIQPNTVTNTKLSDMPSNTVKVRSGATSGDPSDLALSTNQLLGRGTGDIIGLTLGTNLSISGSTLNATGGGSTTTEEIQDAIGTIFDSTLVYNDAAPSIGRAAISGDVDISAGNNISTINPNAVTNTKLADMLANTIKVRNVNSDGDPQDMAVPANTLVGRGSTGNIAPITLGTNLSFAGGVLNASGVGGYNTVEDEGSALTQRSTVNFTGAGVTVTDSGSKTVVSIPGATWPLTRGATGGASYSYIVLSGTPNITYSKSGGVGTMTVTGGSIQLVRFSDTVLDAERDGLNNFKWNLVGTGTDIQLARPTSTKYTMNATDIAADASTNATIANQVDQDNTPPILYGNISTTFPGAITIRSNNIPTSGSGAGNGYDFIWL